MEQIKFTKTVRSLAEVRDIDISYWYNQLGKQDSDDTHCVEITVTFYKTKDFDKALSAGKGTNTVLNNI